MLNHHAQTDKTTPAGVMARFSDDQGMAGK
jgi:hypothetical protein